MDWDTFRNILSFIGFPTLMGLIIGDIYLKLKTTSKKASEKRKQDESAYMKQAVKEVVEPMIQPIKDAVNKIDLEIVALEEADQAVLRNDLWAVYRHCEKRGYKTDRDMENFSHMYAAYKKLNGNSFIDDLKVEFDDLMTELEYNRRRGE